MAHQPGSRMRDVADLVGITERAVREIVRDPVARGYLRKEKVGRRNPDEVVHEAHLRHPLASCFTLGAFVGPVLRGGAESHRR